MSVLGPDPWLAGLLERAERAVAAPVFRYLTQGAHDGLTAAEAPSSWAVRRFAPHVLRDVSAPDLSTSLLGHRLETPLAVAPTSMQLFVHPRGEVAMAEGVAAAGSLLVVPSNAGSRFSDIAATGVDWWLQAYVPSDRAVAEPMLRRAVDAGAKAVALTVDTPLVSTRYGADGPEWDDVVEPPHRVNFDVDGRTGARHARDLGPHDLSWLAEVTGLPVVVKGVLRADDARRCADAGAAAVWVSNHGGRQLDRTISTAAALPAVASAVGDAEVYVDGGVRSGIDALAAVASGARGVFLGRLPVLALAVGGPEAVTELLERLRAELLEAMQLAGCGSLAETPDVLA